MGARQRQPDPDPARELPDRPDAGVDFPVTVGGGKRLFAEGSRAAGLKLVDSKVASNGVIIATYEPAGELKTGTIGG